MHRCNSRQRLADELVAGREIESNLLTILRADRGSRDDRHPRLAEDVVRGFLPEAERGDVNPREVPGFRGEEQPRVGENSLEFGGEMIASLDDGRDGRVEPS